MSGKVSIDIETFSECDLKRCGAYRYAEDPSTEVLCLSFAFDDEPVQLWIPYIVPMDAVTPLLEKRPHLVWTSGRAVPARLRQHIEEGGEVHAHNYAFERTVLNRVAGRKINFPTLTIAQGRCTAARCRAHGLPGDLDSAAGALGLPGKDETGRMDMLALSKPRKGKEPRWTPENAPERFARLYGYNCTDTEVERSIGLEIPDLPRREQRVFELDACINDRGTAVDLVAVENARTLIDEYKRRIMFQCELETGYSPTQRDKIAEWVRDHGYPHLSDLQVETIKHAVKDPRCPPDVATILRIYSTYNAKAVSKYDTIADAVCADGRLRGMFLYFGAGPGRWASRIVQLQNLFRPVIDDCDTAIESFSYRDLDWLIDLYPDHDPLKVLASCIRGMIVAEDGKVLQSLDYAAIESRVNAWLWGEEWKLKAFREFDAGTGPDLYKLAYARAFRVPVEDVTKEGRQRGKILELQMGYEGGVGAFVTMANTNGLDLDAMAGEVRQILPPDVIESATWMWEKFGARSEVSRDVFLACDGLKQLWRRSHPKITAGWKSLKEAAVLAVQNPGTVYNVAQNKLAFKVEGRFLKMRLPSGRCLHYLDPETDGESVSYMGVDTETRQWKRTKSYGGRSDENAVQAIARDLLVNGMFELEAGGFPITMTIHDEAVSEIDPGCDIAWAQVLFCRAPAWADGLPLVSEGWQSRRYKK